MRRLLSVTQEMAHCGWGNIIPRIFTVRRVPGRYQGILPLTVMKRYQCVVIGRSREALTVGITDQRCIYIFKQLSALTGCTIFPVLIDPVRMHLLLRRVERSERKRYQAVNHHLSLQPLQIRSTLVLLASQGKKYSLVR